MRSIVVALALLAVPVVARANTVGDYASVGDQTTVEAEALATGKRIMVIGDSIQTGTGLRRTSSQASWRVQRSAGVIVHNFSSPGATMADSGLLGMTHATTSVRLVDGFFGMYGLIINLGRNDWAQPAITLSSFSSAYGAFLDSLAPTIKVACMSPTWNSSEGVHNAHGNTMDDFRGAIRAVCEAQGAAYLDGKDAIPNDPAYFRDGVHPNDRGHKAMGVFLLRRLRALGWLE